MKKAIFEGSATVSKLAGVQILDSDFQDSDPETLNSYRQELNSMKTKYAGLLKKALDLGAQEAKILSAAKIIFDPRAFLKCRFGCNRWGTYWTCPPHTNFSPQMFGEAFSKYEQSIFIKTRIPIRTGNRRCFRERSQPPYGWPICFCHGYERSYAKPAPIQNPADTPIWRFPP